jgi:hypothetical protein
MGKNASAAPQPALIPTDFPADRFSPAGTIYNLFAIIADAMQP